MAEHADQRHDVGDDQRQVWDAAHAYEAALVAGDTAAATAFFDDDPSTSRFGPDGSQLDLRAVHAVRAATAPTAEPTWLHDSVRMIAPDVAIHVALLDRGTVTIQRTQVWVRRPQGWRIVHAHVSRPATP